MHKEERDVILVQGYPFLDQIETPSRAEAIISLLMTESSQYLR